MREDSAINELRGVGTEVAKKLAILGIKTVGELITNYPRRFDDYSSVQPIRIIKPGSVTIKAVIKQASGRYVSRGLHVTEAVASDETGSVRLVWFNQPYRAKAIKTATEYYISGDFALRRQRLSIQNPSIELVDTFTVNTARIVPVYRETKGFKSHQIRKFIREVLPVIRKQPETLPSWLIKSEKLMSRAESIEAMHFPKDVSELDSAKKRLGLEEVFELSLAALINKQEFKGEHALNVPFDAELARNFVDHLPFTLTDAQRKVVWQIYQDMQHEQPMNRLIEGDVGSGKTVVATMAAAMAMKHGFQVAFMAPTELLARQHAETIFGLLRPLGMSDKLCLLVGGLSASQKNRAHKEIENGKAQFIIGTHALIQEKVNTKRLGLIIIDEQHRFGVEQRKKLQAKAGYMPHILNLTATPIPRSLALTLYGEMDISIIDAKPAGRKPVITKICSPNSKPALYKKIIVELSVGRQMFVVCPLITDSDTSVVASVENVYKQLSTGMFAKYRVGLLHGRLKSDEKERVMKKFINNELDILVATTVIEVGVDVPNATVMLIENAERFGLAQIHQLRGRVGRSSHQGYCYLMMGDSSTPSARLKAVESTNDGFQLAEMDLEIRGAGAIYGTIQHGLLDLRIAKLSDVKLIAAARKAAHTFIDKGEKLVQYEHLNKRIQMLRSITNLN